MVLLKYQGQQINEIYEDIKEKACGRQACSVLILIANEVDAMATSRMVTQLLRSDNVAYALRPVSTFTQIKDNYQSFVTSDIKTVIMINCGAMHNIPKEFELDKGGDVRFIIFDNHRPFHLANRDSRHNVVVFVDEAELLNESMDWPSSGSENENEDDSESGSSDEEKDDDDNDDEEEEGENMSGSVSEGEAEEDFDEEDDDNDGDQAEELDDAEIEKEGDGDNEGEEGEDVGEDGGEVGVSSASSRSRSRRGNGERGGEEGEGDADDEGEGGGGGNEPDDYAAEEGEDREGGGDGDLPHDNMENEDEEEGPVRVIGRRRPAEAENPVKIRRRKLRQYYAVAANYSPPTAMMMMNLVWRDGVAHVPLDTVWQAILGVTDQYQRAHISDEEYSEFCNNLKILLGEHQHESERVQCTVGTGEEETVVSGAEVGHIVEVPEYRFFLYRHWSMFDAMYHSPYIASKMPVWQAQGTVRLKELLAKMGVPLYQCEQSYTFMAPVLKTHFRQQILKESLKTEFNLMNPDVTYRSFFRYNSFKNPVGASDVVYAASSLLEMFASEDYPVEGQGEAPQGGAGGAAGTGGVLRQVAFNEAYDCLGMQSEVLLKKGVLAALALQRMIVKKAAVMLENHDLIEQLGRLYFSYVDRANNATTSTADGEMDSPFSRPLVLARLGQFIMEVKRNTSKRLGGWVGRRRLLPLILIVEKRSCFLVVGVSPLDTSLGDRDLSRGDRAGVRLISNFKQFFKLAAKDVDAKPLIESFDSNVVEVSKEDMQEFLGSLNKLLKNATRDYFVNPEAEG